MNLKPVSVEDIVEETLNNIDDNFKSVGERLAQTTQNVITIDIEQWGLSESDGQGNTTKLNTNIASLDDNKVYEIIVNKVFSISGRIDVTNKLIRFSGFGGFKATVSGITMVKAVGCFGITFKDVLIDGNGLATRGIDLENCPYYLFDNARIENVGNTSLNNVYGLFLSFGNDYGDASRLKIKNVISSSVASGVIVDNWRDNTKFSRGLRFDKCEINNIQPVSDGDGLKVLQGTSIDCDILIENTRFIKCSKRGIKTQSKGVRSRNNYFEDSFYASIDFQLGGGISEDDTVVITQDANVYQLVEVSGNDCVVKGLKAKSQSASTNTRGIVVSAIGGTQINKVVIDNVDVTGVTNPLQFKDGVTIDELSILRSEFSGFAGTYVGLISSDVKIKNLIIDSVVAKRTGSYFGFLNFGPQAIRDALERYRITNSDIGFNSLGADFARKQGFISRNISHSFEEENGIRRSFTSIIPSSTSSTLYFHAKKGDIAINTNISELGSTGSKYIVKGWVCIADGDVATSNRGTWVQDRALTGN